MRSLFKVSLIAVALFAASGTVIGQDLLLNPQNQKYLFTAGTDEPQAFLYNPAYLGLGSHGSALDAYYFYPSKSVLNSSYSSFHDIGISAQGGKFALAYRNAESYIQTLAGPVVPGENLNQYSAGLGVGNEGLAFGAALSMSTITSVGTRWFPAVGMALRPNEYLSLGLAYHNFSGSPFGYNPVVKATNLGASFRPFGTDVLTLDADILFPAHSDGYKIGIDFQPLPGLRAYGIYDRSGYTSAYVRGVNAGPLPTTPSWGNSFSIGLSFNFGPHLLVEGASSDEPAGYAASYGRIMITSNDLPTILLDHRVAEIVIKGNLPDASERTFFFIRPKKTLLNYVEEIRKCGDDPSITALVLKIYPFSTSESFFSLSGETQELADAVDYVRQQGKEVYAYLADDSGVNELYLASAADKIYMAPVAFISGYGIDFDLIRMKGLFDKLHITWNERTAGKYKSTFHTIYTDSATPEQAQLIQGLSDDIYSQMLSQIEVNRGIVLPDSVKAALSGLLSSRDAAADHVIDGVAYYDDFRNDVSDDLYRTRSNLTTVDPAQIIKDETVWGRRPEVAVIGVYGTITTGESSAPSPFPIPFLGGDRLSGSETVCRQINAAASDNQIKAIVLRVNSGGGSALASDQIYNALKAASEIKPVVASFGNMAASGGYYVATGVGRIFAEPATLTGSIGVVIAFPVLTDFLQKDLGTRIEEYRAGENSSLLSPFHSWTESDLKYVDSFLNEVYFDFKSKVSAGRKLTMDRVEDLAQGKVYTARQALGFKLIDAYGGLDRAIRYAADKAGISDRFRIVMFEVPGYGMDDIFDLGASILGMLND